MKGEQSLTRARITYMFRETFRAHSKDEYREFLTRGLKSNKLGLTGTYAWLYVRVFFALFILFTVNVLVVRLTGNTIFVPTLIFFASTAITVPFTILLYELYQKRDLGIMTIFGVLAIGGTASALLSQIGYAVINVHSQWLEALMSGLIEETSKALIAIVCIIVIKKNNPYACFLIAAAVGAGFSIIEDSGYMYTYSDIVAEQYGDVRNLVFMFVDRGFSSLCTHILWTGLIGFAYGACNGKRRWLCMPMAAYSIALHTLWNAPFEGWTHSIAIALCTIISAVSAIIAISKSLFDTLMNEFDIARINDDIIRKAKEMGERMRFTNAANLTFALTCTLLSMIAIALCCLPIGMEKMSVTYDDRYEFIAHIEGGYNIKADWSREYDKDGKNVEERSIYDGNKLTLSYVVQEVKFENYDGIYYYGYYINSNGVADKRADSIYLELDDFASRIPCVEYTFGDESEWVFEVMGDSYSSYIYDENDGTVSCVIETETFEGYNLLIGLVAGAVSIAGACAVILFAFTIKLRRVRDEG